jgi:hypothetical protein
MHERGRARLGYEIEPSRAARPGTHAPTWTDLRASRDRRAHRQQMLGVHELSGLRVLRGQHVRLALMPDV